MTLLLSNEDVDGLVSMAEAIQALETGYEDLGAGHAVSRRRIDSFGPTAAPGDAYLLSSSEAIAPGHGVAAVRISSHVMRWRDGAGGARREKVTGGGPPIGLVLLFATATGEPLAILQDTALSVLRVGATSALAARRLAPDVGVKVALLGTGRQARGQLDGLNAVRRIERVACFSPTPASRAAFAREFEAASGIPTTPVTSPERAIDGANILLCATNSLDPVVRAEWVRPGVHVSSIRPTEVTADAAARADIAIVHTRETTPTQLISTGVAVAERGAGGPSAAALAMLPDLADLVVGRAPGRSRTDQATCFLNTIGLGLQFAVLGGLIVERARARGLGRELPTSWFGGAD